MSNGWGGAREGAGRKPTGRKRRSISLTDEEFAKVKQFVSKLREQAKKAIPKTIAVLLLMLLFMCNVAFAQKATIESDGSYIAGERDSFSTAKEMSRQEALRMTADKAGVYVLSYSETRNAQLTADEIRIISSAILKVKSATFTTDDMGGQGMRFICRVVATVDTEDIEKEKAKLVASFNALSAAEEKVRRLEEENQSLKNASKDANAYLEAIYEQEILKAGLSRETILGALNSSAETAAKLGTINPSNEIYRIWSLWKSYCDSPDATLEKCKSRPDDLISSCFLASHLKGKDEQKAASIKAMDLVRKHYTAQQFHETSGAIIVEDMNITSKTGSSNIFSIGHLLYDVASIAVGCQIDSFAHINKNGKVDKDIMISIARYSKDDNLADAAIQQLEKKYIAF